MGTWNYRVVRKEEKLAIHEVYYDDNGEINAFTSLPIAPYGEDIEDLGYTLGFMKRALELPVLDYDELMLIEYRPPD
ncbi:hypothetical protein [Parachitinimonas caeni]|uniref:Uncharacterized protein n=1 Tax=Parachitinimonas caeni TaxID=3031301 RepID=A0ABT7DZ31_9NEIS|nr:hypothetical protein [Parachitinimonas caeni]MDK2125308.1 hypothetical protein [Parachitinimonas caeni]